MCFKTHPKRPFLLIEVLIAITLLLIGCFANFEIQNILAKKTKEIEKTKTKTLLSYEALASLIELFQKKEIPFECIANQKLWTKSLSLPGWKAKFIFKNKDPSSLMNSCNTEVTIILSFEEEEFSPFNRPFYFLIQKRGQEGAEGT